MVQLWYMKADSEVVDPKLDNHLDPAQYLDLDHLKKHTNVLYWKIDPNTKEGEAELNKIRDERGYSYQDLIEISRETLPNYDEKLKNFYKEHLHTDEEIRYCLEGSGYFDVRDQDERWIRIKMEAGDLIVLPAGIYHRFTLDTKNYAKVRRLFVGEPVWTAYDRPADDMDVRKEYVKWQESGFASVA